MTKESEKPREIEKFRQTGPTCCIYAIAAITQKIFSDIYSGKEGINKIASKIFQVATDKELAKGKELSEIGEFFEVGKVEVLLERVNESILTEHTLYYEILEFDNESQMKCLMKNYLKNDSYILFPYFPNSFDKGSKKIAHWGGALYEIKESKINGREGLNMEGEKSLNDTPYELLYESNNHLERSFKWSVFYECEPSAGDWWFRFCSCKRKLKYLGTFLKFWVPRNKYILKKLCCKLESPKLISERVEQRNEIKYDMKGKMVVISGKEIELK